MVEQKFQISPKTHHEWLASVRSWGDWKARLRVAEDIITNAREVESGVDWSEILDRTFAKVHGRDHYTGKLAVTNSIAGTVGSVASNMGWSMQSPEVVYMSGYYFFWGLGKDIDSINQRLNKIDERIFDSEESRKKRLQKEQDDVARLGTYRKRLGNSLDFYTNQSFPAGGLDEYLEILQKLLWAGHNNQLGSKRYPIFNLLKAGQIREAYVALTGSSN